MEGLVNYSSEDEQDDYPHAKVAVRERGSSVAGISGRSDMVGSSLKRSHEHSKDDSFENESSYRKSRDLGNQRFKSGNASYNEDKYKIDRRADNSREHREKRDNRDSKNNRDLKDDRDYDYNQKYEYKKHDDQKRYREQKRDYKRDGNDYYREDKRYNRYDDRKPSYPVKNDDRFNSKSRYDNRKQYEDRFNEERKSANEERRGDRRKDFTDRRNYNDDNRKTERRSDDRKSQRSYNDDRYNSYRPRRSNSPPPSHASKSNNKYSERKEDSNVRRDRKRHSRSKSRSRSRSCSQSADNAIESNLPPINISHQRMESADRHVEETKRPEPEAPVTEKKNLPTARNFEALLSLPLSESAPKHPNVVTVPPTAALAAPIPTTPTVQLPSYYNPNVINPNKYVEQMQKRKLIWGAKKSEDSASKWGHAQFSQDQDGKVASKFMRLMGIKTATGSGIETPTAPIEVEKKPPSVTTSPPSSTDVKSREAMFSTMEHQYEVARQVTHTMRGVGLGFSSQSRPY